MSRNFLRDERAATAAEFALVVPVFLIILFAIIDAGRLMYTVNRADKAVQWAARHAAVTDMVPSSLATYRFATGSEVTKVTPGSPVPATIWAATTCTATSCTNQGDLGPTAGHSEAAYLAIRGRILTWYPEAANAAVTITYTNVGLGFAGDPFGPDVAPAITVTVAGTTFRPITLLSVVSIPLPPFTATISMEDGRGRQSN